MSLVDGCRATASVSGNTGFANLDISTTSGRQVDFEAGSIQTVTGTFSLLGTAGNLLVLRSSVGGSVAFLDVQGTGSGDFVDVADLDATAGNSITLGPDSVTGSNTPGWLLTAAVPALGVLGMAVLALSLAGSGSAVGETTLVPLSAVVLTLGGWRSAYIVLAAILVILIIPISYRLLKAKFVPEIDQRAQSDASGISVSTTSGPVCAWMPDEGMSLKQAIKTPIFWGLSFGFFT